MNRAPIDIVIQIIDRHILDEIDNESEYGAGIRDGLEGLKAELEGFKKLFN